MSSPKRYVNYYPLLRYLHAEQLERHDEMQRWGNALWRQMRAAEVDVRWGNRGAKHKRSTRWSKRGRRR